MLLFQPEEARVTDLYCQIALTHFTHNLLIPVQFQCSYPEGPAQMYNI